MQIENWNGKIYDIEVTGKGIEPLSACEVLVVPPAYFIGKFDSLEGGPTNAHLIFFSHNRKDCDLVFCWLLEAIYENAEFISIPKGTYTKGGVVIPLPRTLEQSDFELKVVNE